MAEPEPPPSIEPSREAWYAVHTRSRHERKVESGLRERGLATFLPLFRTWSRRSDRKQQISKPLFPGYLFIRIQLTPASRLSVLQAPSVVRIVGIRHQPVPVPDHEVESIRILLQAGQNPAPHEGQGISAGQLVEIMEGALRGVIGRVERGDKRRIVVRVDLLGREVSADLDTEAVVPYLDHNRPR